MLRLLVLTIPVLLALSVNSTAQDLPDLVTKVKSAVAQRDSCWELKRAEDRKVDDTKRSEQDWVCRNQVVGVYYFQERSPEAAAKLYREIITSPVQAPGRHLDSPKFGEESSISTYNEYSTSSYIFFRRGNIVVRIDSSPLERVDGSLILQNAITFATVVDQALQNRER